MDLSKNKVIQLIILLMCMHIIFMPSLAFATTAGGTWSQGNVVRQGATSLYHGILNAGGKAWQGVASFKPNVAQVSKQIAKVGAVGAVTTAVDMLLGGVDWILDTKNHEVVYYDNSQEIIDNILVYYYYENGRGNISAYEACSRYKDLHSVNPGSNYYYWKNNKFKVKMNEKSITCIYEGATSDKSDEVYVSTQDFSIVQDVKDREKRIPLDVVSAQVISNAESKDEEAVQFVAGVADANITEAQKQDQWERTKAPAVPGTGTGEATGTNTGTGEATGADPTKAEPTEKDLPAFCGWAPVVCDIAGKISDAIDWAKAEPELKDEKLEIKDEQIGQYRHENHVKFGSSCPFSPESVSLDLGVGVVNFNTDLTFICDFGHQARGTIIGVGYLLSLIFLIRGLRGT